MKAPKRTVPIPIDHARAIARVLTLVDRYLAAQPQDTLTAGGGGLMTWGELRKHVQGARELLP